jgi:hypothetical protein
LGTGAWFAHPLLATLHPCLLCRRTGGIVPLRDPSPDVRIDFLFDPPWCGVPEVEWPRKVGIVFGTTPNRRRVQRLLTTELRTQLVDVEAAEACLEIGHWKRLMEKLEATNINNPQTSNDF